MNAHGTTALTARSWSVILATLILFVNLSESAKGYEYYPLAIGTMWYYENDLGETNLMSIVREETLLGAMTHVRLKQGSQVIETYWSVDTDGHVYLHGGRNFTYPFELAYLPPLRMVDAPLYLGKEWVTEDVGLYDFQGNFQGDEFDYPLEVYFEGELVLPAGTFHSYGIGFDLNPVFVDGPSGEIYDVQLNRIDPSDARSREDVTDWYTDGVGPVQYTITTPPETWFKLHWWNPSTRARESTWGQIKTLFK
jgi:hypothetical protein